MKKKTTLIASIVTILLIGTMATLAFLTDHTGPLTNIFSAAPKYTLTYHANAGSDDVKVPDKQTSYGSAKFDVSTDIPTRDGFVFTKWAENPDGTGKALKPGDKYDNGDEKHSHLYAQWEGGYTLIYDANRGKDKNGKDHTGKKAPDPVGKITGDPTCTFEIAEPGDMSFVITVNDKETEDYRVFLGWSEDPAAKMPTYTSDGELAYIGDDYEGTKPSGLKDSITIDSSETPSKTKTLYAVWANRYELNYSLHPELTDPPSTGPLPEKQTAVTMAETYTFHIPKRVEKGKEGPGEVANSPERKSPKGDEYSYYWGWWGDNLNRFGYREDGTSLDNTGCYLFDEDFKPLTKDVPTWTLYAYFQPPSGVSLIYNLNDGALGSTSTRNNTATMVYENYDDNGKATNKPRNAGASTTDVVWETDVSTQEPTHPRYEFLGWAETPTGDVAYRPGDEIEINKIISCDKNLYAVWKNKHKFRVTFNRNDNAATMYIRYKNDKGNWTYSYNSAWVEKNKVVNAVAGKDKDEYYTDSSMTLNEEDFSKLGFYATRDEDNYGVYEFKGWSYKSYPSRGEGEYDSSNPEHTVDFPVANPTGTSPQGDEGLIKGSITVDESDPECTKPVAHNLNLYAVWERSPMHNFKIRFERNASDESIYKGTSSAWYQEYSYPYDYTSSPRISRVKAIDMHSYTWAADSWTGANAATTSPTATKKDTNVVTYEFLGWSTQKNKTTAEDVEYHIDSNGKLTDLITVGDNDAAAAKNCDAGTHTVTLYPVFKPTPRHSYNVYFDVNKPTNLSGINTVLYQQKQDGTWFNPEYQKNGTSVKDVEGVNRTLTGNSYIKFSEVKESGIKALSWPDGYATSNDPPPTKGMFATCGSTTASKYTFLGWSYTKYKVNEYDKNKEGHKLEFPVANPDDPSNPTGDEGQLKENVTIDVDQTHPESDQACTLTEGKEHNRVLYGVWSGEVLHQYSVKLDPNGGELVYGSKTDWDNNTTTRAKTWEHKTVALEMPTTNPTDSYTFGYDFWKNEEKIIAEAEKETSDGTVYKFKGWGTKPDLQEPDIELDDDGYIKTDATAACEEYPCDGNDVHNVTLYAIWDTDTKVHKYSVIFYNGGSKGSVQTKDSPTDEWSNATTKIGKDQNDAKDLKLTKDLENTYRVQSDYIELTDPNAGTYTFKASDKKFIVRGYKAPTPSNDPTTIYDFVGWARNENADTPEFTVDEDGYIEQDIVMNEPRTSTQDCEYDTHNLVLYPVFKPDKIHRFSITFDRNGGTYHQYRNSNNTGWNQSSTNNPWTYYYPTDGPGRASVTGDSHTWTVEEFWNKTGIGATKNADANYTYEFVGWSTNKQENPADPVPSGTISWRDDPDSNVDGRGYIDEDITVSCPSTCEGGNHNVKYYAVWKATPKTKKYHLVFKGNPKITGDSEDDVSGVPAQMDGEKTYDSSISWSDYAYPFDLPATPPTYRKMVFVGWSTNPDDTQGTYGHKNSANPEIAKLTNGLENPYPMKLPATNSFPQTEYEGTDTLYAIWWYEFYLEYRANGGSNAPALAHAYTSKDSYLFTLSNNKPVRNGYTFLGWSTDPDATTPMYQPGQQVTAEADMSDPDNYGYTDFLLYAVWKKN